MFRFTKCKVAAFTLFLLFTPEIVRAQIGSFTCSVYQPNSSGTWPSVNGSFVDCQENNVSAANKKSNDANVASYITNAQAPLLKKYAVKFYLFTMPQDMFSEIHPNQTPDSITDFDNGTSGETYILGSATVIGVPVSSVWEYNKAGANWPNIGYPSLAARHEIGHQMDLIWAEERSLPPVGGKPGQIENADPLYVQAVQIDQQNFQNLNPSGYNIWETQYTTFSQSSGEFFAEMYATANGGGTEAAADAYLSKDFPCTYWYMVYYAENNKPAASLTANSALQQYCKAL